MNRKFLKHRQFLRIAVNLSHLSTCYRGKVGCVLVDINGLIIGTGYNGVPAGMEHCSRENLCLSQSQKMDYSICRAVHAEINALMACADITRIVTAYVNVFPCMQCLKALLNTTAKTIVYREGHKKDTTEVWLQAGREIMLIDGD